MKNICFRLGMLATPWWITTLLIFGALEPNYSHLYNAVSELGAFGAENTLGMNVFCLFLTGALVTCAGIAFRMFLAERNVTTSSGWWVIFLGVMLSGAAVPADMSLYFESPWTVVHAFFVFFGVLPFGIAAWQTHRILSKLSLSSTFISYFPLLLIPVVLLHGILSQGGLVQRLTILIVLVWVSYLSWYVSRQESA